MASNQTSQVSTTRIQRPLTDDAMTSVQAAFDGQPQPPESATPKDPPCAVEDAASQSQFIVKRRRLLTGKLTPAGSATTTITQATLIGGASPRPIQRDAIATAKLPAAKGSSSDLPVTPLSALVDMLEDSTSTLIDYLCLVGGLAAAHVGKDDYEKLASTFAVLLQVASSGSGALESARPGAKASANASATADATDTAEGEVDLVEGKKRTWSQATEGRGAQTGARFEEPTPKFTSTTDARHQQPTHHINVYNLRTTKMLRKRRQALHHQSQPIQDYHVTSGHTGKESQRCAVHQPTRLAKSLLGLLAATIRRPRLRVTSHGPCHRAAQCTCPVMFPSPHSTSLHQAMRAPPPQPTQSLPGLQRCTRWNQHVNCRLRQPQSRRPRWPARRLRQGWSSNAKILPMPGQARPSHVDPPSGCMRRHWRRPVGRRDSGPFFPNPAPCRPPLAYQDSHIFTQDWALSQYQRLDQTHRCIHILKQRPPFRPLLIISLQAH